MTIEQALIAAVVTLAGAVAVLWKMAVKRWNECESDRRELHKQINQLHGEIKAMVRSRAMQ